MNLKATAAVLTAGTSLASTLYAAGSSQKSSGSQSSSQSGDQQDKGAGSGGTQSATPMTTNTIMEIQQKLNDQGYKVGKPDEKLGPSTRKGISDFQIAKGIPQTGHPDPQTMSALNDNKQNTGKGGS